MHVQADSSEEWVLDARHMEHRRASSEFVPKLAQEFHKFRIQVHSATSLLALPMKKIIIYWRTHNSTPDNEDLTGAEQLSQSWPAYTLLDGSLLRLAITLPTSSQGAAGCCSRTLFARMHRYEVQTHTGDPQLFAPGDNSRSC